MNNKFILKLVRLYFRFTSTFMPTLAMNSAYKLFHTPIQSKSREIEDRLAKEAKQWSIEVDSSITLQAYRWGNVNHPLVLIVHGWSSSATSMSPYITMLLKNNFQVISYDAINHKKSRGKVSDLSSWAKSVSAVVQSVGSVECIIAHSLGAAAVVMASNVGLNSQKLVLISPMNDAKSITDKFGKHFSISLNIIQKMRDYAWEQHEKQLKLYGKDWKDVFVSNFHVPTLIIHDKNDAEVSIEDSKLLIKNWKWAILIETEKLGHRKILYSKRVMNDILDFIRV
ncbi:MAG: alpha/beta hydrolase [Epsilonproteobacteria bacterium]|nr:alpha/beta hydrolase [Campylobacterota bacterium]